MDEEEEQVIYQTDMMAARAALILHMAQNVHTIHSTPALEMTLKAMDCLLYSINPPRGQMSEVKH